MVFFVRQIRTSSTIQVAFVLLASILAGSFTMAGVGAHYPDCELRVVSDNHVILKYNPEISEDLLTVGRTGPYPVGDREVIARVILLAIPPGGNFSFTANFSRAGWASPPSEEKYITEDMPLVQRSSIIDARGHRLARLAVFPQRMENGRLAVYKDFVIDINLTPSSNEVEPLPQLTRLDTVLAGSVINSDQFYRFGVAARRQAFQKPASGIFDQSTEWVRIAVTENGVTRITGAELAAAGVDMTDLYSDSLRLFYSGGESPPESLSLPEPELSQISIMVEDGDDGLFGTGDRILFYAQGPDRYEFRSGVEVYVKNIYDSRNYYWLAVGGFEGEPLLRWSSKSGLLDGTPDVTTSSTRKSVRFEQENLIKIDGDGRIRNYYDWFWSDNQEQTISINLPDLVLGDSVDIGLGAITSYNSTYLWLNGTPLNKMKITNDYIRFWDNVGAAVSGLNSVLVKIYHVSGYYVDFLDVNYSKQLSLTGSQMTFSSQGLAGIVRYRLTGYTPSSYVLNITDPDSSFLITGVQIMGDTGLFQRPETINQISEYTVYSPTSLLAPDQVEAVDPGDLRRDLTQYDCIAIAPRQFLDALGDYVTYRYETGGNRVKLVAVEDIYNNFGFGLLSPMAIRNYLKFAFENYDPPAPFAALLIGDGNYDFLDNLGRHASSYIPPFIWSQEYSVGDDNYVYFGRFDWLDSDSSLFYQADRGWDMMIARWPVRTPDEIASHIAAIKTYEAPEDEGNWKTRITYVADDEFKGGSASEIIHTAMAESLAVYHTPPEYVKQKIYATDYPFASNGEKPSVNDAIIRAINEGTLITDYIGHGSPDVWADEHILKKSVDLGRMQNTDKLTVIVAGSCSIGFFDDPGQEGMAEIMFRQDGAAIETVSATRLVYATDNAVFNYDLFDALFGNRCNVSEAVYSAKVMHQYTNDISLVRNDRAYVVFGDPLSLVGLPEYQILFDVDSDSLLTPLQYFGFSGSIADDAGNMQAVDGIIELTAYDSRVVRHHPLGLDYTLGGPVIFRGSFPVEDGLFEGGFIVPLDIDYGGDAAQLAGYGNFGSVSGIGGRDSLSIASSAASTTDNSGPVISYQFEEVPDFVSGGRIPANATVIISLSDPSGINLTGGLGHRIESVIDNDNNTTVNLTDLFTYTPGSYQSGELRFTVPDLTPERHLFKIRAWDNANNPAQIEFEATPSQEGRMVLTDVMNYPNPMEESTEFFFNLSESAAWVELKIFTLSGRMIKSFRRDNLPLGKNRQFFWNGRDLDGDRVAEGVYIYKISARGNLAASDGSADNMAEAFGKLVLLN